ncbi:MAG: BMP family ABC transporter substrate-binding protein [Bacillota bacterium]|nr:BMP family ABC transporter substrate-binding protein [Bacillota bacterium]
MRRRPALVSLLLALSLVLAACGGAPAAKTGSPQQGQQAASGGKTIRVGLVTDVGGLNDHSFNYLADQGLQRAKTELGIQGQVVESHNQTDYIPNLTNFAQQGYDLVIAVGFLMTDAVKTVAKQYPDTKFLLIDDQIEGMPNVASAMFRSEQAGYLVGALTGLIEKQHALPNLKGRDQVAVIGGMKIPPVDAYIAGFQAGVKAVSPQTKVNLVYEGKFDDPTGGREVALSQIAQGSDILFHVAGGTGTGVIKAAESQGVYAIGVDADQNYLAPQTVITSALKRVDVATFDVIKSVRDGTFQPGVHWFDLTNDGVGYAKPVAAVPQSIVRQVEQIRQQIIDGQIKVPATVSQ